VNGADLETESPANRPPAAPGFFMLELQSAT